MTSPWPQGSVWWLGLAVICAGLAGCDPLAVLDEEPRWLKEPAPRAPAPLPRVEALVSMRRADLLTVVAAGTTQAVHLAGVCAPATSVGRYNTQVAAYTGVPVADLPGHGRAARSAARGLLATGTWRLVALGVTTNNGVVRAAVDFVNERDESMTAALLQSGFAARVGAAPRTVLAYDELERAARAAERGMWRHAVPLARRLRLASAFERETLSRDQRNVYQQRNTTAGRMSTDDHGAVLERHENIEERGIIALEIAVQPPVTRAYELVARYRFIVQDDQGRNQQSMSGANDTGQRITTRHTPDRARISETNTTDEETLVIIVTNTTTQVRIASAPVEYTKSEKAGVAYQQGQTVTGYELEVWLGTNVIYQSKKET